MARDPAFYKSIWTEQSDTPAHEGPNHHAIIDLWTYAFPLSPSDATRLAGELRTIPPLLVKDRAHQLGDAFTMRRFFDEFTAAGVIPLPLIRWQMTGLRE